MQEVLFGQVYEGDDWISEDHFRTETRSWDDDDDDFYDPSTIAEEMNRSVFIFPSFSMSKLDS